MDRMLGRTTTSPQNCTHRNCTCYWYDGTAPSGSKAARRKGRRTAEKRAWKRAANLG